MAFVVAVLPFVVINVVMEVVVTAAGLSLTSKEGFMLNRPHWSADAGLGCPVMV